MSNAISQIRILSEDEIHKIALFNENTDKTLDHRLDEFKKLVSRAPSVRLFDTSSVISDLKGYKNEDLSSRLDQLLEAKQQLGAIIDKAEATNVSPIAVRGLVFQNGPLSDAVRKINTLSQMVGENVAQGIQKPDTAAFPSDVTYPMTGKAR